MSVRQLFDEAQERNKYIKLYLQEIRNFIELQIKMKNKNKNLNWESKSVRDGIRLAKKEIEFYRFVSHIVFDYL